MVVVPPEKSILFLRCNYIGLMCHKQRFPLHFIVDLKLSNTLENEHNFWHVECHTAWTTLVLHTLQSIVMR